MFFGSLIVLLMAGMPIAFAFMTINIIGVFFLMGGTEGLTQLILSIHSSVSTFALVPVPMFILMGEVLFRSGIATRMLNVLDIWLAHLPGRLSLVTVAAATLFAALSGSSLGTTAMLGTILEPDMRKRGYHPTMICGPIMAGGKNTVA